tara:strand:- start:2035 stop:2430 length:396 start_codon:yes stop_codon:yes gene_type:complete
VSAPFKIFGVKKAMQNLEKLGADVGELVKPEVTAAASELLDAVKEATPVGKTGKLKEKNKLFATRVSKNTVTAQVKNRLVYARVVEWGWDGKGRNSFMRATAMRMEERLQDAIRNGAIARIEEKAKALGVK